MISYSVALAFRNTCPVAPGDGAQSIPALAKVVGPVWSLPPIEAATISAIAHATTATAASIRGGRPRRGLGSTTVSPSSTTYESTLQYLLQRCSVRLRRGGSSGVTHGVLNVYRSSLV